MPRAGQLITKDTIIKEVVLGSTFVVTLVAMWYIYDQMNKVKPAVIYERRKARYDFPITTHRHSHLTIHTQGGETRHGQLEHALRKLGHARLDRHGHLQPHRLRD